MPQAGTCPMALDAHFGARGTWRDTVLLPALPVPSDRLKIPAWQVGLGLGCPLGKG